MPGQREPEDVRREQIIEAALAVAGRERLDGLTIRKVAAQAGLSPGLVHFHFGSKEVLLASLLDWMLDNAPTEMPPEILAVESATCRFAALIRSEFDRLIATPVGVELFFDFWAMGAAYPTMRERIRGALAAYRSTFEPLAEAAINEQPDQFAGQTPIGLASLAVSLIEGAAVQAVIDPEHFDRESLRASIMELFDRNGHSRRDL